MKVSHHECYTGEREPCGHTHNIHVVDERRHFGTVRVIASHLGSDESQYPDVKVEIGNREGFGEVCPVFHLAFNADALACSLYKQADGTFLLRLEQGVELLPTDEPGEYVLKENY